MYKPSKLWTHTTLYPNICLSMVMNIKIKTEVGQNKLDNKVSSNMTSYQISVRPICIFN